MSSWGPSKPFDISKSDCCESWQAQETLEVSHGFVELCDDLMEFYNHITKAMDQVIAIEIVERFLEVLATELNESLKRAVHLLPRDLTVGTRGVHQVKTVRLPIMTHFLMWLDV